MNGKSRHEPLFFAMAIRFTPRKPTSVRSFDPYICPSQGNSLPA